MKTLGMLIVGMICFNSAYSQTEAYQTADSDSKPMVRTMDEYVFEDDLKDGYSKFEEELSFLDVSERALDNFEVALEPEAVAKEEDLYEKSESMGCRGVSIIE